MKFSDLYDDVLNEGKNFTDENFYRYANNAGMWLFELFIDNYSKIPTMPGYLEYKNYVARHSDYSLKELNDGDTLAMTLPDYYKHFINEIDYKLSNKIMGDTIKIFNLQDKMSGREGREPMKRGRKPKSYYDEPQQEPQSDDSDTHFDQAVEKRKRGRPALAPELKKYQPKGMTRGGARPGAGRPRKERSDDELAYQDVIDKLRRGRGRPRKVVDEPIAQPAVEPVMKKRGRPSKEDMANKYEPEMVQPKIKTLEDRIASLEALLREKGILSEQRTLLESRLKMMKDYRKFL